MEKRRIKIRAVDLDMVYLGGREGGREGKREREKERERERE